MSPSTPDLPAVRLGSGPDLAAAVPHLIGFTPTESLVLVTLTGPRASRVGVTLRVDLPPPGMADVLADQVLECLAGVDPSAVVVLVFTEQPDVVDVPGGPDLPGRAVLAELVVRLAEEGVSVREALLVRAGRCWSYDCPQDCCAPGAGRPLPGGTSPLAAASTFAGQVLAADRTELVDRLRPVHGAEARAVAAACDRVGRDQAELLAEHGRDALTRASWQHLRDALAGCAPGRVAALSDDEVARAGLALVDPVLRDRALALGLGVEAAAAGTLWTQLTRRLPPPLDAEPATLLAVTAWARGDGATANTALDRALSSHPGHALAGLLRSALDAALPPAELRRLVLRVAAEAEQDAEPEQDDGAEQDGGAERDDGAEQDGGAWSEVDRRRAG